jgi:hypothetical protein
MEQGVWSLHGDCGIWLDNIESVGQDCPSNDRVRNPFLHPIPNPIHHYLYLSPTPLGTHILLISLFSYSFSNTSAWKNSII